MKTCWIVLGFVAAVFGKHSAAQSVTQMAAAPRRVATSPLAAGFVPNLGQWPDRAVFRAKLGGKAAFLERSGWTLVGFAAAGQTGAAETAEGRAVALRMSFGDEAGPGPRGEAPNEARQHYFLGSDPASWRRDVPTYGSVLYEQARPGIDVRFYQANGQFAFDVLVAPDASAADLQLRVDGMQRMGLDDGRLVLETELGTVYLTPPVAWEEDGARRVPVASRFALLDSQRFGFEVEARTPGRRLVIDPGFVWSASFGGSDLDRAETSATEPSGATCVAGFTFSADFPVTPGAFDTSFGNRDAFVTRLAPAGAIQFTTFLGGSVSQLPGPFPFGEPPFDEIQGLALDSQARIYVTGTTLATDFPTTPGVYRGTAPLGGPNVFVTRLAANGASLDYSTYVWLGRAAALAVDAQGRAVVVGSTSDQFWPITAGAISSTYSSPGEGFVVRVGPTGAALTYSTFLSGNSTEEPSAVAIDAQGRVVVAGSTRSSNLPTTPSAFDPTYNFGSFPWDAFVLRFAPNLAGIDYCSYLGGLDNDLCSAVAVDVQGEVVVSGYTLSSNFPTTPGAFDTTFGVSGGPEQVFVTRFAANGSTLVGSTFVGGALGQIGNGCVVDARGDVIIVGNTGSGFPITPGAADATHDGGFNDAFVARLRGDLTGLVYSSYLPGSGFEDIASAVGIGAAGQVIVTGWNAYDVFVVACDMLPTGATAFGASSPGCNGPQWIGVDSMPKVGNSAFTITLGNAPPAAFGIMAWSDLGSPVPVPVPVFGVNAWLDLSTLLSLSLITADARGRVDFDLPIPGTPTLVSLELNTQFVWGEPAGPAPCPSSGTSASNALRIVIQP